MIRVVVDSGNSRTASGVGVYTSSLLDGLREFAGTSVRAEESTISEGHSSLRPLWRLRYLWRLRGAVRDGFGGADVVHFTNVFVPARSPRCAYVATVHDLEPLQFPEVTTRRYVAYFRWAIQKTLKTADVVLTDTEAVRREIVGLFPWSEEKLRVCGIGISPAFMRAADQVPRAPRQDVPMLLFVGTFTKKKNVAWLTRTVSRGVRSRALPKLQLVLAGQRGHGGSEVEAAVAESGGTATIVNRPDLATLASLYRRAEALVLPSHTEGFGIPLVEGAYCGIPVIASAIPTSLEVAAGWGEFFEPGSEEGFYRAVRTVLGEGRSADRQASMRACVKRYSWEHLVPLYVSAYAGALERRGRSST